MRAGVDLGGTKIDVLIVEGERDVRGRARRADTDRGRRRRGRSGRSLAPSRSNSPRFKSRNGRLIRPR
jgi:hypothetical protein